ncbi:MAG TPA: XRE family transcriptional regulator [Opitutales bacterium]|nr:XRE family transcriptional regulator [Opitutales bacterium]
MTTVSNQPIDPKVLGERLKRARAKANLTQGDVAEKLNLARTTVVAIEKGERASKAEELDAFRKLYAVRLNELIGLEGIDIPLEPQFRAALKDTECQDALDAASKLETYASYYLTLEKMLGMRSSHVYPPPYAVAFDGVNPEQAGEEIADEERNRLGLGSAPISNLRNVLEEEVGLRVFFFKMGSKVSGIFAFNNEVGGCIGINRYHPVERCRWTLAHEYGHFLTTRFEPDLNLEKSRWGVARNERLVDSFAANFLMPRSAVNRRFSETVSSKSTGFSLADLFGLADYFLVSVNAMCLRLEQLRRLTAGTWDSIKSQGLKVETARTNLGLVHPGNEEHCFPLRYRLLARSAYEQDMITEGQLARFLDTDRLGAREELEQLDKLRLNEELSEDNSFSAPLLETAH